MFTLLELPNHETRKNTPILNNYLWQLIAHYLFTTATKSRKYMLLHVDRDAMPEMEVHIPIEDVTSSMLDRRDMPFPPHTLLGELSELRFQLLGFNQGPLQKSVNMLHFP